MTLWFLCATSGSTTWLRSKAMVQSAPQTSPPRLLRVALLGAGARGADWLTVLTRHDAADLGVMLCGICDPDAVRAVQTASGLARSETPDCNDLPALLTLSPDIVVDATSPLARFSATRVAMRAGVHVICDPPLALDEATATALVGAAGRAQGLLSVAYQTRHRAGLRQLQALVASGVMGRPLRLRCTIAEGDPALQPNQMRFPAIEACDAARAILGCEALAVRCSGAPMVARFDMAVGATFELAPGHGVQSWQLHLEGGMAVCEGSGFARADTHPERMPAPIPDPEGLAAVLVDLVAAIRAGGRPHARPAVGPRGAAASLAMVLALRQSMSHGGRSETVALLGLMGDASNSPSARVRVEAMPKPGEVA